MATTFNFSQINNKNCHPVNIIQEFKLSQSILLNLLQDIANCNQFITDLIKQVELPSQGSKIFKWHLIQNSRYSIYYPPSIGGLLKRLALTRHFSKKLRGQTMDIGRMLQFSHAPASMYNCAVEQGACGISLKQTGQQTLEKRISMDLLETKPHITEHRLPNCNSGQCTRSHTGEFPKESSPSVHNDLGAHTATAMLTSDSKRQHTGHLKLLNDTLDLELNKGTSVYTHSASQQSLELNEETIRQISLGISTTRFDDESRLSIGVKLHWPYNCSNALYTYLLFQTNRCSKALNDTASFLHRYFGQSTHSLRSSYLGFQEFIYGSFGKRLIRFLEGVKQQRHKMANQLKYLFFHPHNKPIQNTFTVLNSYDEILDFAIYTVAPFTDDQTEYKFHTKTIIEKKPLLNLLPSKELQYILVLLAIF